MAGTTVRLVKAAGLGAGERDWAGLVLLSGGLEFLPESNCAGLDWAAWLELGHFFGAEGWNLWAGWLEFLLWSEWEKVDSGLCLGCGNV